MRCHMIIYDNMLYMYYEIVLCLHRYTSEELKYFPLNTAMLDPPKDLVPGTQDLLAAGNQEKEVQNGDNFDFMVSKG